MNLLIELPVLIPIGSRAPPEAQPFIVAVMVVGVVWWVGGRLWADMANRRADRLPRFVLWYEDRSARSRSCIKMGGAVALIGLVIVVMFGGTPDATPNSLIGLAIFAIGFAQFLYGTLVLH